MSTTQTGQFTVGAVGLFLHIQINVAVEESFDFTTVSALALKITRPDGTEINRTGNHNDPILGVVNDASRIIQYVIQAGDLTLQGAYGFRLTITFVAPQAMVETGSFSVSDAPESGLIVETGEGLANANSYATLAEANTYHRGNLYATAWDSMTADRRETSLMMATRIIDTNWIFNGWLRSTSQALQWPRIKVNNPDAYGLAPYPIGMWGRTYYDESSIPIRLKQATAQVAFDMNVSNRTADNSNLGIASLGVGQGAITLDFNQESNPGVFTEEACNLLAKLGHRRGGAMRKVVRVS